jgi:hypothetical protein
MFDAFRAGYLAALDRPPDDDDEVAIWDAYWTWWRGVTKDGW